jgi:hypothetical protein
MSDSVDQLKLSRTPELTSATGDLRILCAIGSTSGAQKKSLSSITKEQLASGLSQVSAIYDHGSVSGNVQISLSNAYTNKMLIVGNTTIVLPTAGTQVEGSRFEVVGATQATGGNVTVQFGTHLPDKNANYTSESIGTSRVFIAKYFYMFGDWHMSDFALLHKD